MRSVWRRTGAVLGLVVILSALIVPAASAAPAPAPARAPAAQGQVVYWVQPGDSWFAIGARFGISAWSIAAANGMSIYNTIYPGQRLIIPYGGPGPNYCTWYGGSPAVYYTVRRGDTLAHIAALYGMSYWTLAQLNGITNVNRIYAGRVLLIRRAVPGYQVCLPAPPPPCTYNCGPFPIPGGYIGPWTGDYFATPDLSGDITVKRLDGAVNFNWGWGPPAAGMPNFNWSARWTRFENYMAGGVYQATVTSDDGVRVYVDGVRIIDAWVVQAAHTYSQEFSVQPGAHTLVIEYFQAQGVSEVHFQLWKVG